MRSSFPSGHFIKHLRDEYKLKTLISLEDDLDNDIPKEIAKGLNHITKWNDWSAKRGITKETLIEVKDYMISRLKYDAPVLVRCRAGADRTGLFCAIYRVVMNGWCICRAKAETLKYLHFPPKYPNIWKGLDMLKELGYGECGD